MKITSPLNRKFRNRNRKQQLRQRLRSRLLRCEALEERALLSFTSGLEFVSGELLIKLSPAASEADVASLYERYDLALLQDLERNQVMPAGGLKQIASTGEVTEELIALLERERWVEYAEPNYILTTTSKLPDDTYFDPHQWGLHNTGQNGGAAGADIRAPEAWDITTGSSDVVVLVIDTGVDYNHPDLAGNMWVNPGEIAGDGIDNDGNGYVDDVHGINTIDDTGDPMDDQLHGTHVAGTIGAVGNNGRGVSGVAWDVSIAACKFLPKTGSGSISDAVECFNYANDLKTRSSNPVNIAITNNSWGGGGYSQALVDAMRGPSGMDAILHVTTAGNGGLDRVGDDNDATAHYPSSYRLSNIVSVAATDRNDELAAFSNFGKTSVDLAAPGVDILSTNTSGGYQALSGTSMAAPHVAGAAALVATVDPSASASEIKHAILGSAEPLPDLSGVMVTGGRLNLLGALQYPEHLATIARSDAWFGDQLGTSVAISGDTAVVGVPYEDHPHFAGVSDIGAAYVYMRTESGWTEQAELLPDNWRSGEAFGYSVAIDGDVIVVGAPGVEGNDVFNDGAVFVFERNGTTWTQKQEIVKSIPGAYDEFGTSLAISGDTLIVGAPWDDHHEVKDAGSAYVFARQGETWQEQQLLRHPDPDGGDRFGAAVSVSGDAVVVGVPGEDSSVYNTGSAFIYTRTGSQWTSEAVLTAGTAAGALLGTSVSLSADTVVVGAPRDQVVYDRTDVATGAAYVFARDGSLWSDPARLSPAVGEYSDEFGRSVAVEGNSVVVGAPYGGPIDYGVAHVYVNDGVWKEQSVLRADEVDRRFGWSVAMSGELSVVGAPYSNGCCVAGAGRARIFDIFNPPLVARDDAFSVAEDGLLSGDVAANDTGEERIYHSATAPANGTVALGSKGTFTYTPAPDFFGTDSFFYSVTDSDGAVRSARVLITVSSVNDLPTATADHPSITVLEGAVASNGGSFGDADPGDTITLSASVGAIADNGDGTWSWSWQTSDGPEETQEVAVTATDSAGDLATVTFGLTVENVPPIASVAGYATGVPNQSLTFTLDSSDVSPPDEAAGVTYSVDWDGDGTLDEQFTAFDDEDPTQAAVQVSHLYTTEGSYTIQVTATDKDDDQSDIAAIAVEITGAATQDSTIIVGTSDGANSVEITEGSVVVTFFDALGDVVKQYWFDDEDVTGKIIVYGSDQDDRIRVAADVANTVEIYAGAGDDIVQAGSGTTLLDGGEGDDTLVGGSGLNTLVGGEGDDVIQDGGGSNTILAGSGSNTFVPGGGVNTFQTGSDERSEDADPPQLIVSDAVGSEGSPIPLNIWARLTDLGGSETLHVTVGNLPADAQLSAGTVDATGVWMLSAEDLDRLTVTRADDGQFVLAVTATAIETANGSTASVTGMVGLTVENVAPVVNVVAGTSGAGLNIIDEGDLLTLNGVFTDPGARDTHQIAIDWGDGTTPDLGDATVDIGGDRGLLTGGSFDGSHIYADDGVYTVTLRMADDDMTGDFSGTAGVDFVEQSFQVTVHNVDPTLAVVNDRSIAEGGTLNLTDIGTFTDPGFDNSANPHGASVETFTYAINWGDSTTINMGSATVDQPGDRGLLTGGSFDGSHIYSDDGVYTVTLRMADDDMTGDFSGDDGNGGVVTASFTLEVTNVPPAATLLNDGPVTYGQTVTIGFINAFDPSPVDTDAGFRYSFGLAIGDLANTYVDADGSATWDPELTAGTHTVYGRIFDKDDGYNEYTTTVIVDKAPLTITANDQVKVYGAADPVLSYTPSGTLFYGDTYDVISGVALATVTGPAAIAGSHAVTATGGTADNYAINHVDGTLTVAKAELTVTADDQSTVYGDADPVLSYTPSGTLFYDDVDDVISGVILATATGPAAIAGSHAVTASGGTADNYAITHVGGTLTVAKAELTVTADDQSKVYGDADPVLSYTPSGTLFYDDVYDVISGVVLATATGAGATAGTHTITATGGTANNYNIIHVNGTLSVETAELTVTVQDADKVYGDANPPFFVDYAGFVYADDVSVLIGDLAFSTPAETFSDVGAYVVSASGLEAANYALHYVEGTLAVTQAEQSIQWSEPAAILQGMALTSEQLNANVSGLPGGSAPGELIYDSDFGTVLDAGFHTLSVTAAETQNYLEATASVAITVSGVSLLEDGTLMIVGTDGADRVHLNGQGRHELKVHSDFFLDGKHKTFSTADIDRIVVELLGGDDHLTTAGNVHIPLLARAGSGNDRIDLAGGPAVVVGGVGSDDIQGGAGRNVLIGGLGANTLKAGRGGDVLVAGATDLDDDNDALFDLLESWNSNDPPADRMDEIITTLAGKVIEDDGAVNTLHGGAGHDLFFADLEDKLKGNKRLSPSTREGW